MNLICKQGRLESRNTIMTILPLGFSSVTTANTSPLSQSLALLPDKITCQLQSNNRGRRVWRRRKLTNKDDMLRYKLERIPFLEEQVRKIREGGKLLTMDIERLLLSEDNRFDFVNEVAAEANEYVDKNRDEYGGKKKAILHVLSNRMNDAGVYRPEAYEESDPFKPPGYMLDYYT
ncbi:protein PLASTID TRANSCRIPTIONALLY ACTIVE 7 [Euphorbia lathyris]|uniref:protein PLASTID TRANSCRIPTIONALLY ACTIVE 7 n=1 Tax=Euphorbia lathyris TaxID=212925 RepID=UPI003313FFA7